MICAGQNQLANNRISELPDDILCHIVSSLPMKEVGRTCVLSKRWKHVWAYVPTLNFDSSKIIYRTMSEPSLLEGESLKYLSLVDRVISSFKAPIIDEFRVQFDFSEVDNFEDNIYNWLRFAMEKRVKRLEMDFSVLFGRWAQQCFTFPKYLSCTSLTSLELGYINVTGEILESFLCNCVALEYLSVKYSKSLVGLTVTVPLFKLKSLIIECCLSMKNLEISAPNLVYMSYIGHEINMKVKNTPKLAQVSFGGEYAKYLNRCFSDLSSCLSQIVSLTLCPLSNIEDIMLPREDFVLPRLRNLNVSVHVCFNEDLYFFGFLMKACPTLLNFNLQLLVEDGLRCHNRGKMGLRKPFLHYHLKNLKIEGFCEKQIAKEIAIFLLEMAVALEDITIDPTQKCDVGRPWASEDTPEKINARVCAEEIRPHLKCEMDRERPWSDLPQGIIEIIVNKLDWSELCWVVENSLKSCAIYITGDIA